MNVTCMTSDQVTLPKSKGLKGKRPKSKGPNSKGLKGKRLGNSSVPKRLMLTVRLLLACFLSLSLVACSDSKKVKVEDLPDLTTEPTEYRGPPPASGDIQAFKVSVWDNLVLTDRCGACHSTDGQVPTFVRADDINLAYAEMNTIVNSAMLAESRVVEKVSGGHNCWLDSDAACGEVILAMLNNWFGGSIESEVILLQAPDNIRDPGQSKIMPATSEVFTTIYSPQTESLHELLINYCSDCHQASAATPQSPFFASANSETAYAAVLSKIDINNPANSRLVLRLRNEFHNCWSDNCAQDAQQIEELISAMAANIPLTAIDPGLVFSKALNLADGIPVKLGGVGRYDRNVIARYEFKTGEGTTAYDTSGVEPGLNLTLIGGVEWVGGWGIQIVDGAAKGLTRASKKLNDLIRASGEYSIEMWLTPNNVTQEGPAVIAAYSAGTDDELNFLVGQTLYSYDFLNRSENTDSAGVPAVSTPNADEVLQASLQHVVVNFDPVNGRRIFVNGVDTGVAEEEDLAGESEVLGGGIQEWDDNYAFALGNNLLGNRLWQGIFRMVAVHNRVLTQEQIIQNFDYGVGQSFYLLFQVSDWLTIADAYDSFIVFEVSQYDNYSYLFNKPFFLRLYTGSESPAPAQASYSVPISKMRIGVNGKEVEVGQAFRNLSATLSSGLTEQPGQVLSEIGTVIPVIAGPDTDEFFLTFEMLGVNTNVVTEAVPLPLVETLQDEQADIGLRTFSEIHSSMAKMTAVTIAAENPADINNAVVQTYERVEQQLPSVETLATFSSSHQIAVTQLSIEYCNELVISADLRSSFFPDFYPNLNPVSSAFSLADRQNIIQPLLTEVMHVVYDGSGNPISEINNQPDAVSVEAELNALIDDLSSSCSGTCSQARTETVIKATCAAAIGSASMLLH